MRPIFIVMFLVDVAMFAAIAYAVAIRKPSVERPRPLWRSLAMPMLVAGMVSSRIAGDHPDTLGAEFLQNVGLIYIGMALMTVLVALRQRRGLDDLPPQ